VVLARPVADALGAPLDVIVARKIGAPGNPEFAIGAVTARGTRVLNERVLRQVMLPPGYLQQATEAQREEAERREAMFRGLHGHVPLAGKTALIVDDGVATGMTMFAAIADARAAQARRVVVAAPVIAPDTYQELLRQADAVEALEVPADFFAVGQFYENFAQTTDDEVKALLSAGTRAG
ncbi:MAG TPA: phosphoribosyltransferase family protein, partial [Oscillatoriaceae cyanobacterium]